LEPLVQLIGCCDLQLAYEPEPIAGGLDLGPDTEQRLAVHAVYVHEYDIVDAGRVREGAKWIGRTDSAATVRSAPRSGLIER
jgi:hypothetical protein